MKNTGSLRALAEERLVITRPGYLIIPISGALFFLSLIFGLIAGYDVWISTVIIFAAILVVSLANRFLRENRVHEYEISYSDNRDTGGELDVQYVDLKTSRQTTMAVEKLILIPKWPLWSSIGPTSRRFYSGTMCSLKIVPKKGNYSLVVGFPNVEQMNAFYKELGGEKENDTSAV